MLLDTMARKRKNEQQPPSGGPAAPNKNYKNVGLPNRLHERVKEIADEWDRSVNWTARRLIELGIKYLEEHEEG